MADHLRKQAIDAIVTALSGLTTTEDRVFIGHISPRRVSARAHTVAGNGQLARTDIPGLIVRSGQERIDTEGYPRPRIQSRYFSFDVLVNVRETDDYEDVLHDIFMEVEIALASPSVVAAFGGKSITLRGISDPDRVQNEVTYVQAAMNYEVFYLVAENAPDVAL